MLLLRFIPGVLLLTMIISSVQVLSQPVRVTPQVELPQERLPVFKPDTGDIQRLIREAQKRQYTSPEAAAELLDQALHQSRLIGYHDGAAWALFARAGLSIDKGAYVESRDYFRQAYQHCRNAIFDKELLSVCYSNMALTYVFQGNYALAMYYYYTAIEENRNKSIRATCLTVLIYGNLAGILADLGQSKQARYYLEAGEKAGYRFGCRRSLAYLLNNKGNLLLDQNEYEAAEECYRKSLELGTEVNDAPVRQAALANLGHLWLKQSQPEAALPYLEQALQLNRQANPYYATLEPLYLLGNTYAQLKQYKQAESLLKTAIQKAQDLSVQGNLPEAHKSLAGIYEITDRPREALTQLKKYILLKDSLMNMKKTDAINQLEIKYRTAEKDRELTAQQLLISRQQIRLGRKNLWIISIAAGALLLAVSWGFLYRGHRQKQRLHQERIRNLEQQKKIELLQATVSGEEKERSRIGRELHDGIGGMLSAVKMNFSIIQNTYPGIEKDEVFHRVFRLLDETAGEVRKTAHNLMPEMLFRHGLHEALAIFCESISHGNQLHIDFQSYGDLETLRDEMKLTIYRAVQELVQNIIKHAGASDALVQLSRHDHILSISVEDNGSGYDPARTKDGLGLQSLRSRVIAMNGTFSLVSDAGSGTKAYIEFDLG
jgi:signal transduction histidine kinase